MSTDHSMRVAGALTPDWRLQGSVFGEPLQRTRLPKALPPQQAARTLRIGVIRNDACEPTLALTERFAAYLRTRIEWNVGAYDDTLTWEPTSVDAMLVWPDWRRLDALARDVIEASLARTRDAFDGPMAVLPPPAGEAAPWRTWLDHWTPSVPDLVALPVDAALDGIDVRDPRLASIAGSDLSSAASLRLAQWLGITWCGSIGMPPLKAVAIDLDNTLYAGVLGEDGVGGLVVTDEHRNLGQVLRGLRGAGLLLTLVSKNDASDVARLMEERGDLPIDPSEVMAVHASWEPKPTAIAALAAELGIGVDAFVLVDDNPGELALAESAGVWAIDAQDPSVAARALSMLPKGAGSGGATQAMAVTREADLRAATVRLQVAALDPISLHADLETRIDVHLDADADLDRVAELLAKTNQFNLTLARTPRTVVGRLAEDPAARVVSVQVADRLADSGVVGALLLARDESGMGPSDAWQVVEFVLSCRILGRGLEDALFWAMARAATGLDEPFINLRAEQGPRNQPAASWAARVLDASGQVAWQAIESGQTRAVLAAMQRP